MAAKSGSRSLTEPKFVLVRGARQLITLRGAAGPRRGADLSALTIIRDGALLIRDGRIEEIGPTRRIERLKMARNAAEVDATGMIVLPAFVDSGTRPVLRQAVDANRKALLEAHLAAVLSGMVWHGTVTAEVLAGYSEDVVGEGRLMRLYASLRGRFTNLITSLSLNGSPPNPISRLRHVHTATASIGPGGIGLEEARGLLWAAQSQQLLVKIQTSPERSQAAAALALSSDAHAIQGLEGALPFVCDALARSPTVLVLTPSVTYEQNRDSFGPARDLIDKGAVLALGTGFNRETTSNYNMLHTMNIACRYTRMSPEEAITAATINAAHAVGCAQDCGSLEPGKRADLVLFHCSHYADLVQSAAVHQVSRVLRLGQTVYRRGRVEEPQ